MTSEDDGLGPLDSNYVAEVLSKPPFVCIPGVCNIRDIGSYPTTVPNVTTKSGYVFRSAEVSHITNEGVQKAIQKEKTMFSTSLQGQIE